MEFVQAKWYTKASRRPQDIRLEVLHTMEAGETARTAEAVAHMFATTPDKKSAHRCYDNDSVVQCVYDKDIAYAAPGANNDGRHYEMAGYARQTNDEWHDPFSTSLLARVAIDVSKNCEASGNAKTWLSDAEVLAGRRGICDHAAISRIYKKSNHTDCGPNFPKDLFIDMVRATPLLTQHPTHGGGFTIMQDARMLLVCPIDGGFQKLQSDGAVFNSDGCSHYAGGWNVDTPAMVEARKGQPTLPFTSIARVSGGNGTNYVIMRQDGAVYGPDFGYGLL